MVICKPYQVVNQKQANEAVVILPSTGMHEELFREERARLGVVTSETGQQASLGLGTGHQQQGVSSQQLSSARVSAHSPAPESMRFSVSHCVLKLLGSGLSAAILQDSPFHFYKACTKIVCNWHIHSVLEMKTAIFVSFEY